MSVNKIIKSVVVICISICSVSMAYGQMPKRSPEERAQNQTQWMQKNLGLTQEQNKKVYDIILYYAREADKTGSEAPGPEKKMEKQGIKKDKDSELRAVLSPDQFSRYQAHMQEMKERQRERRGMN